MMTRLAGGLARLTWITSGYGWFAMVVPIMVAAIVIAVLVMMFSAKPIGEFVDRHPTVKMLALAFLILVGVALVAEGGGVHIPKGYIYFAMAFSVAVEMLNIRMRSRRQDAIKLRRKGPDGQQMQAAVRNRSVN